MANSNIGKHCQQSHAHSESKEKHCQNVFAKFRGKLFFREFTKHKDIKMS